MLNNNDINEYFNSIEIEVPDNFSIKKCKKCNWLPSITLSPPFNEGMEFYESDKKFNMSMACLCDESTHVEMILGEDNLNYFLFVVELNKLYRQWNELNA